MVSRKGLLKAGYNRNLVKMGYINILIAFFHYFTIAPILLEKCDYMIQPEVNDSTNVNEN